MSQDEYFKLVGLSCSDKLRQGLDLALKPLSNPDPYKYAELCHDYFGNCRMLMDNGWCRLQYECGEDVMTYACRYFPRSPRLNIYPRTSCSCGCEETIEMLIDTDLPVSTTKCEFSFELAANEKKSEFVTAYELNKIQNVLFEILQDDGLDVDQKITNIRTYLLSIEGSFTDTVQNSANAMKEQVITIANLLKIAQFATEQYLTMSEYCNAFISAVTDNTFFDVIESGKTKLHNMFHNVDKWICKMFVNDIFYNQFPYIGEKISMSQAGLLLECEIRLLMALLYSNAGNISNKDNFVDLCMYYFRMVDFTPFSHNALVLINN